MSGLQAKIAEVLEAHEWQATPDGLIYVCECGRWNGDRLNLERGGFDTHVSELIAAVVREAQAEAQAEAWDEGYEDCEADALAALLGAGRDCTRNPYRKDDTK